MKYIVKFIKNFIILVSSSFIYLNEKDPLKLVIKESTPISIPLPKKDIVQGIFIKDGLGGLREASVKEVISNLTTSQCISATVLTLSVCYVGYNVYKYNKFSDTNPMDDIRTYGNLEFLKYKLGFQNKMANLSSQSESVNLPGESYFSKFSNIIFTFFKKLGKNLISRHSYTNDKSTGYNPLESDKFENNLCRLEDSHILYKIYIKLINFYNQNLHYEHMFVKQTHEKAVLTSISEIKSTLVKHSNDVLEFNKSLTLINTNTMEKTLYDFHYKNLHALKLENTNLYHKIGECQEYYPYMSLNSERSLSLLKGQISIYRDIMYDLQRQMYTCKINFNEIQPFFDINTNDIINSNQQIIPIVPTIDLTILNQNVDFQKPGILKQNLVKLDSIISECIQKKKLELKLKNSDSNKLVNLNNIDKDSEASMKDSFFSAVSEEVVAKETSSSLIPNIPSGIEQLQQLEFIHEIINTLNTQPTTLVVTSLLLKFSIKLLNLSNDILIFDSFKENINGNLETLNTHIESLGQFLNDMWVGIDIYEDINDFNGGTNYNENINSKNDDDDVDDDNK